MQWGGWDISPSRLEVFRHVQLAVETWCYGASLFLDLYTSREGEILSDFLQAVLHTHWFSAFAFAASGQKSQMEGCDPTSLVPVLDSLDSEWRVCGKCASSVWKPIPLFLCGIEGARDCNWLTLRKDITLTLWLSSCNINLLFFFAAFVVSQFCCLKQGWGDPLPSWPMQRSGHEVGPLRAKDTLPPVACIITALWLHLNPLVEPERGHAHVRK